MPIRINLLAEQQAAEEMRRRDPVKRAIVIGVVLVLAMIGWIALAQMQVRGARSELQDLEARLKKVDDQAKAVRDNQMTIGQIEERIKALETYATNRFFWATLLDALQHAAVPNVRLVEVRGDHRYSGGDLAKLFTTNVNIPYIPPAPLWKFWASAKAREDGSLTVSNEFPGITNGLPFTTNILPYTVKITPGSTNLNMKRLAMKTEFSTAPWAKEVITLQIKGRDYGNSPGAAIDEYAKKLAASPFFKEWLDAENGFRFIERPPQPRPDPTDPINPAALFVPFTLEGQFKERLFTP